MEIDDKELFSKIQNDNKKAFDSLFHKYYVQLCRFSLTIVQEEVLAEEVVQETFINIWQNRKSIQIEKSIVSYLYTSVRYKAINYIQSSKIRMKHEAVYASETENETLDIPFDEDVRIKAIVNEAIRLLPDKCREIFYMVRFEGLTHEEIADYLKISKKTVENQMTIAFQKIRQYLNQNLKSKEEKRSILLFLF